MVYKIPPHFLRIHTTPVYVHHKLVGLNLDSKLHIKMTVGHQILSRQTLLATTNKHGV